jgi:hypothetical protein
VSAAAEQPAIGPDTVVSYPLNVKIRHYRGRTVVGSYQHNLELSESASFICRQIDGARTVAAIAELVATEYMVDAGTAVADTAELLGELVHYDIVRVRP